jgi:hypothetical protein
MYQQFLLMDGEIESADVSTLRSLVDEDNQDENGNCYECRVDYLCVSIALLKKLLKRPHKLSRGTVGKVRAMIALAEANKDDNLLLMDRESVLTE